MPDTATIFEVPAGLSVPGLTTRDLTFSQFRHQIDPFLVISQFDMRGPVFPPHPHAGFSVATYIFPESDIGFWNQDTLGTVNEIRPGALHLTVAGSGVLHEETVARSGRSATGLQIWIDHAQADREVAPQALHMAPSDVPTATVNGVTRRVLLGASGGLTSPLRAPVSVRLIDLAMQPGTTLSEPLTTGETGFLWVREGEVTLRGQSVPAGWVGLAEGDRVIATARVPTRLTVFAGRPLRQPIVPAGPFVAGDATQAQRFRGRFASGQMGRLTPFDQAALDRAFAAG